MIVPFWLAYLLARRGIDSAFSHVVQQSKQERKDADGSGAMGLCLCREKDPGSLDPDPHAAPATPTPAVDSSFREFFSQGRQWRLGVATDAVGENRGQSHNGRSQPVGSSGGQSHLHHHHHHHHGRKYQQPAKSIDALVLETLALIRTLVDK